MQATMRDTSRDYRTYWLRDGEYYGKARSLGEVSCALDPQKLARIPADDRKILLDEVAGNPSFCAKVARCMATQPNWEHLIAASAKEAIVNELDPSKFQNRKGMWPKLRARTQELVTSARDSVRAALSSMSRQDKVSVARQLKAGGRVTSSSIAGLGGLGQWDIIASLVGTVGKVGSDVYTANLMADTQEDIARIRANAAMNTIAAQESIARAQASMAAIQSPVGAAVSTLTSSTVGGIPVLLIAIPLIGGLIYLFMKK